MPDQNIQNRIKKVLKGLQKITLAPHIDKWGDKDCDKTPQQRKKDYINFLNQCLKTVNSGFVPQALIESVDNLERLVNAGGDA